MENGCRLTAHRVGDALEGSRRQTPLLPEQPHVDTASVIKYD
jgi:hypothetical protein